MAVIQKASEVQRAPEIVGKDIKLHIASAWKQKDKICLQLSGFSMMPWLHSISNHLYRCSVLTWVSQTNAAELDCTMAVISNVS